MSPSQPTPSHCFAIGLAGGSASGKSTFAAALQQALQQGPSPLSVRLVSTDSYFLPLDQMPKFYSPSTGQEMSDYNHPDSIDAPRLLADLQAIVSAPDHPAVLLVEGLMVLHRPEIRELFDLRLFIEIEGEVRALRRMVRNLGSKFDPTINQSARAIANYYLESARVGHEKYIEPSRVYADLILRGDADFSRTAPMIASLVRASLC